MNKLQKQTVMVWNSPNQMYIIIFSRSKPVGHSNCVDEQLCGKFWMDTDETLERNKWQACSMIEQNSGRAAISRLYESSCYTAALAASPSVDDKSFINMQWESNSHISEHRVKAFRRGGELKSKISDTPKYSWEYCKCIMICLRLTFYLAIISNSSLSSEVIPNIGCFSSFLWKLVQ